MQLHCSGNFHTLIRSVHDACYDVQSDTELLKVIRCVFPSACATAFDQVHAHYGLLFKIGS